MSKIDKLAYQERLRRMTEMFADIVGHADVVSKERCPYMSRARRCTAAFRCRNQRRPDGADGQPVCGHDGTFDYRLAWESRPDSYDTVRRKLRQIRADGAQRRAAKAAARKPE
jgi:hypothetical protein